MADTKELARNVHVDGVWYGPDHPGNQVTAEVLDKIDNPAAFEPVSSTTFDLQDRSTDEELAGLDGGQVDDGLGKHTKPELVQLAADHGVNVPSDATKADIVDALRAAGVEG